MDKTAGAGERNAQSVERLTRIATGVTLLKEEGMSTPWTRDGNGNVVSLASYLDKPVAVEENAKLNSVTSFIDYVNLHKGDTSIVTADEESARFSAIIDYHGKGSPAHKKHRASLQLVKTSGMEAWLNMHNKKLTQEQFALFLEANAADIVSPAAAVMLQVATEMRAVKDVEFNSKVSLDNGSFHFGYRENVSGTYQDGKTAVPTSFQLAVVPYKGMKDAFKLEAKLRYKVTQSRLELWYVIPDLERMMEQAFSEVRDQILTAVGLQAFDGTI